MWKFTASPEQVIAIPDLASRMCWLFSIEDWMFIFLRILLHIFQYLHRLNQMNFLRSYVFLVCLCAIRRVSSGKNLLPILLLHPNIHFLLAPRAEVNIFPSYKLELKFWSEFCKIYFVPSHLYFISNIQVGLAMDVRMEVPILHNTAETLMRWWRTNFSVNT